MAGTPHPKSAGERLDRPPKSDKRKGRQPGTSLRWASDKRKQKYEEREHVRLAVIHRDGGCVGRDGRLPGECGWLPGRHQLEVHEVVPRGRDSTSWLDEGRCACLCPVHHVLCTSASGERLRVVRAAGLDRKADPLPALPTFPKGERSDG